jgi:hypothetical protein
MNDKSSQKVAPGYNCNICKYTTSKIFNLKKHLSTAKHLGMTNNDEKVANSSPGNFGCECGNTYKYRQGLFSHKKKCDYKSIHTGKLPDVSSNAIDTKFVMDLVKKNQELQDLLIEQNKQMQEQARQHFELVNKLVEREPGTINGSNNNNTTNNHQKFNLNFFLNETCKDAMNLNEFVENIRITFQDLLKIGNDGFVTGVSDIFIKELRDLEVTKRPLHCTDSKRETIYVKENDAWNKDDKENSKLKNIIEKVEYKNVAALQQWCNENPESKINNTDKNLLRDKIYLQTLQGDERTRDKIIKNISKEVIIDKEPC